METRARLRDELAAEKAKNEEALKELARLSEEFRQILGNPDVVLDVPKEARLMIVAELLVDKVFPAGSVGRLEFDLAYERRLWNEFLSVAPEQAASELTKLKLQARGIAVPNQPGTSTGPSQRVQKLILPG